MKATEKGKRLIRGVMVCLLLAAAAGAVCYYFASGSIENSRNEREAKLGEIEDLVGEQRIRRETIDEMKKGIEKGRVSGSVLFEYDCAKEELDYLSKLMDTADVYDIVFDEPFTGEGAYVRRGVKVNFKAQDYQTARTIIDGIIASPYRTVVDVVSVTAIEQDNSAQIRDRSLSGNCKVSVNIVMDFIEYINNESDNRGLKKQE